MRGRVSARLVLLMQTRLSGCRLGCIKNAGEGFGFDPLRASHSRTVHVAQARQLRRQCGRRSDRKLNAALAVRGTCQWAQSDGIFVGISAFHIVIIICIVNSNLENVAGPAPASQSRFYVPCQFARAFGNDRFQGLEPYPSIAALVQFSVVKPCAPSGVR
jgi:hypothetical protein